MSRAVALVVMLLAAQPVAAIVVVQMAPAMPATPAACRAGAGPCTHGAKPHPAKAAPASGPLVAGLVGVLVLGVALGRRRPGLPEVVS